MSNFVMSDVAFNAFPVNMENVCSFNIGTVADDLAPWCISFCFSDDSTLDWIYEEVYEMEYDFAYLMSKYVTAIPYNDLSKFAAKTQEG